MAFLLIKRIHDRDEPKLIPIMNSFYQLIPVFDADVFSLGFEPALEVDGGSAAITGGGDGLAIAVIGDITGGKDAGNVGHSVFDRDDVTYFIHVDDAPEQVGIGLVANGEE